MKTLTIKTLGSVLLIMAAIPLFMSCNTPAGTTGKTSSKSTDVLSKNNWQLYSMNGNLVEPSAGSKVPSMAFDMQKMTVSGNSGCNSYSGGFTVQKESLTFGNLATTRMMCEDMKMETAFLAAVPNVRKHGMAEGRLVLSDAEGKQLMAFDPVSK